MKRGFTMIELIFVIVIIGTLVAIAIPKLAATKADAEISAIKATVAVATSAVPAYFTGQSVAGLTPSMKIDLNTWKPKDNTQCKLTYEDSAGGTVDLEIVKDVNASPSTTCATPGTMTNDNNLSLIITYTSNATGGPIQKMITLGIKNTRIPLNAKSIY